MTRKRHFHLTTAALKIHMVFMLQLLFNASTFFFPLSCKSHLHFKHSSIFHRIRRHPASCSCINTRTMHEKNWWDVNSYQPCTAKLLSFSGMWNLFTLVISWFSNYLYNIWSPFKVATLIYIWSVILNKSVKDFFDKIMA